MTRLAALQNQVRRLDARLAVLNRTSDRFSWMRLFVFIAGLLLSLVAFFAVGQWLFWLVSIVSIGVFSLIVRFHRQTEHAITQYKVWRLLKNRAIARLSLDWKNIPPLTRIRPQPDHPFETDLDIVGERSLHQLLDTSISYGGSQRLRMWLANTRPDPAQIQYRQTLVQELVKRTPFRDKLSMNALISSGSEHWDGDRLLDWFKDHPAARSLRKPLLALAVLALANIILFGLNSAGIIPAIWEVTFLVYCALFFITTRDMGDVFGDTASVIDALSQLRAVLLFLETQRYTNSPELRKLCAPFLDATRRPSAQLRRLERILSAAGMSHNPMSWLLFNGLVPWDVFFAHQLSRATADLKAILPVWLDAWYELEAVSSLATFSYLNPDFIFPDVVADTAAPFVFNCKSLGHPLIPSDRRVCNDVSLDCLGEVIIITGSNMAGKSSFLRAMGLNLCLAYAGSPVNARHFQTSLFRLFTCIRVNDSVTDGFSYFYAEVKRLKALLDALNADQAYPLFFLIDEIFRGTNNRERLIGSRAYLRALVGRHGTGAISTHDLELVKLQQNIPEIQNFHFKEDVIDGRMIFDYKLRPGPCPTTNALKIMQLEGLPVDGAFDEPVPVPQTNDHLP